jgi:hypothetical protein
MSDRGEAYLCAISHEEDVFVDKKNIDRQFNILMELDELCGNLNNALHYLLAIPPHPVTLHLEDGASPNHFSSLHILECNITPMTLKTFCSSSTSNLPLAKKFHVVLDHLDESKLTHFLWIADVQATWMHLKE